MHNILDRKIILNLVKDTLFHFCMMLFIIILIISTYYHEGSINNLVKNYTRDCYSICSGFYIIIITATFSLLMVLGDFYKRLKIKPPAILGLVILFPALFMQIINKSIMNHTVTLGEIIAKLMICILVVGFIGLCKRLFS